MQAGDVFLSSNTIENNYGRDYINMMTQLKIYVYPPLRFDADIGISTDPKYGVEQLFIQLLNNSQFVTQVS